MAISLQARCVYPVDRPPIENGVVTIDGERIVAVGPRVATQSVRDLGDVALVPGLINAHTHLEFSHLQKPLGRPGMPITDWIRLVIAERGRGDLSAEDAIAAGLRESLGCGVTAIGEIATAAFDFYAVERSPHLALFAEVIGFSRARADSVHAALEERFATSAEPPGAVFGVSPHAPYTVSFELFERLVAFAARRDLPVAMHLAESRTELEFLRSGTGPLRGLLEERSMWDAAALRRGAVPADYLAVLRQAPRGLVVHGNYLSPAEQELIFACKNLSLVYCPRTHAYFEHDPYPLAELLRRDVRVVLGTDSRASNPDLSLLAEMRFVLQNHRGASPERVLQMATLDAAAAFGWEADRGSLTPGKRADMVALPLSHSAAGNVDNALGAALADATLPAAVWLGGREIGTA
jgi:cytosine/adenosine deaminase-related metal-dependent hydrolase